MKKMKANFCSCSICERAKDAIRRYNKLRVGWQLQAENARKLAIVEAKKAEGMSEDAIAVYLKENSHLLKCNRCNGSCLEGSIYRKFSKDPSTCLEALLCDKVHVPPLDLATLDDNFRRVECETDQFFCYRQECCSGEHVQLTLNADGSRTTQPVCGWDAVFSDMPLHERTESDPSTSEDTTHSVRACPDEYNYPGRVSWMDFVKVSTSRLLHVIC